ncbi:MULTISPECIES: hypothetical protein [Bradyrhizobium]|uniref:hypothetical protein n=1 Tax=Bradyrhizobium TaxID=374 RepID=UPI001177B45C|nr:hypothetical protein [Bradyrhizobium canariense]MBM7481710.1 hypothetical protein [Bradyrhizobium canariense]UFW70074.1 hypothetical protein BcanWU425_25490 [Bradyrhizobium canariense]
MLASICGRAREKENVDGTVGEDLPPIGAFECELTSPLVGMKRSFRRRHFLDQVGDTVSRDLVSDKRQQPTMARYLVVDLIAFAAREHTLRYCRRSERGN